MVRKKLQESEARRLMGGAPVVIVTSAWRTVPNAMPVAWSMPVSVDPPLVAIVVHQSRQSHDMIKFGEEFGINIPSRVITNHTQWLGMVSGTTGEPSSRRSWRTPVLTVQFWLSAKARSSSAAVVSRPMRRHAFNI